MTVSNALDTGQHGGDHHKGAHPEYLKKQRQPFLQGGSQFQLFLLFPEFTGDAFLDVFGTGGNDLSATVGWKNEALE